MSIGNVRKDELSPRKVLELEKLCCVLGSSLHAVLCLPELPARLSPPSC